MEQFVAISRLFSFFSPASRILGLEFLSWMEFCVGPVKGSAVSARDHPVFCWSAGNDKTALVFKNKSDSPAVHFTGTLRKFQIYRRSFHIINL